MYYRKRGKAQRDGCALRCFTDAELLWQHAKILLISVVVSGVV